MIWGAVALYAVAALALAWRSRRGHTGGSEFWTAGRALGPGSVGLSISAGFMSISWSCVYATQLFYWYGLGAVWLITIPWLLVLAGIYVLAPRYRVLAGFSQPEMIARRFGRAPSRVVALALGAVFLTWGGAEIHVAADLLAPALGVSPFTMATGISLLVAVYAGAGGFGAVVATDKLQYALVAFYVLVIALLASFGADRSGIATWPPAELTGLRSDAGWVRLLTPGVGLILLTLVAYVPGWLFETDLWLRVQAARDPRTARRGVAIAMLNAMLFVGVLPLFIGVLALGIYPHADGVAPAAIGALGDGIFAALVRDFAPAWLAAIVALGLVAAAMSTIDTCCNVVALSLGYDLLQVHRSSHPLAGSRLVTICAVLVTWLFALNIDSLWHAFYLSGGILTCAVALPVAAVQIRGIGPRPVLWSSLSGLLAIVIAYSAGLGGALPRWQPDWLDESGLAFIIWGLAGALAGLVAGFLIPPAEGPDRARPRGQTPVS